MSTIHGDQVRNTSIKTSDGAVKTAAGYVFWVSVSAGATGGAWQLNDSTDDSGTDKVSLSQPATSVSHHLFDPPLRFETGIYADIPGTNITLTVGYE